MRREENRMDVTRRHEIKRIQILTSDTDQIDEMWLDNLLTQYIIPIYSKHSWYSKPYIKKRRRLPSYSLLSYPILSHALEIIYIRKRREGKGREGKGPLTNRFLDVVHQSVKFLNFIFLELSCPPFALWLLFFEFMSFFSFYFIFILQQLIIF